MFHLNLPLNYRVTKHELTYCIHCTSYTFLESMYDTDSYCVGEEWSIRCPVEYKGVQYK